MKRLIATLTGVMLTSQVWAGQFTPPSTFTAAKRALYAKVYGNEGVTFYAGCHWHKKKVDLESCGLKDAFPGKWRKRARRVEAEHVIPASWMYKKNGKWRACAIEAKRMGVSMRKHCQAVDSDYRAAHNDLVNLQPAVGAINGLRSNKPFSLNVRGQKKMTFNGRRKVTITSRVIMPPREIRGDIARVAFYMQRHYGIGYSRRQEELFWKWDKEDPVSAEEKARCERIRKIQGRCVFD